MLHALYQGLKTVQMQCLVLLFFPPWTSLPHTTAPQMYEHLMELTLPGLQWSLYLIYLDDVIVFSHDFEEQIDRLDKVLT